MNNEIKRGFDDRIVKYEYIHGNQQSDFQNMITAINPKEADIILDGCGGYMDILRFGHQNLV
jgi:hypothetical protein